ncbi:MAG: YggS family pyridoxal phosphate-dependent enzyme [Deltaproteobacteria bacterium]|nr:YggS family pyridoxal phosphate-dependent enzyme [Deltaproteobacteria bacterium]
MSDIAANYARVCDHVATAAHHCGRRFEDLTIVCAAKTKGPEAVQAALAAGATDIGENYVQEAREKIALVAVAARWHLIGHLQRNKAKDAIRLFSLIHSLDSIALAQELQRHAAKLGTTVRTLIEINLGGEHTKSGIAPEHVAELLTAIRSLPAVRVEGLMTIPPPGPDAEASRPYFRALARLREQYATQRADNIDLRQLSMGMTDDYRIAIEEGATIVRIGRAIFGERH